MTKSTTQFGQSFPGTDSLCPQRGVRQRRGGAPACGRNGHDPGPPAGCTVARMVRDEAMAVADAALSDPPHGIAARPVDPSHTGDDRAAALAKPLLALHAGDRFVSGMRLAARTMRPSTRARRNSARPTCPMAEHDRRRDGLVNPGCATGDTRRHGSKTLGGPPDREGGLRPRQVAAGNARSGFGRRGRYPRATPCPAGS